MNSDPILNILHVDSHLEWGGGQLRVIEQLEWLLAHGYQTALIADPRGKLFEVASARQLPVYGLQFGSQYSLVGMRSLQKIVNSLKVDLIDAHSKKAHLNCAWLALTNRKPILRTFHATGTKNSWTNRWQSRLFCHHFITTSLLKKSELIVSGYKTSAQIAVVGEWAGDNFFRKIPKSEARLQLRQFLNIPAHSKLVAVIGMLRPDKGQHHFIDIAKTYLRTYPSEKENVYFLIIGGASDKQYEQLLIQKINEENLTNHIYMLGYREDIASIMRAIDVVLITSVAVEAQSRIAPQAFASELPVLASHVGAVSELVHDGETGYLVPIGDIQAYVNKLSLLLNDQHTTQRLIKQAYQFAVAELTINQRMRDTLVVYQKVLGPTVSSNRIIN